MKAEKNRYRHLWDKKYRHLHTEKYYTEFLDKHAHTHSDKHAKRGLPYGTGHPATAKKNTLVASEPFQCYPVIFLLLPGKNIYSFLEHESKIKVNLCGKRIDRSNTDFQFWMITLCSLWGVQIKSSRSQKEQCNEQLKKVLSEREKEKREV